VSTEIQGTTERVQAALEGLTHGTVPAKDGMLTLRVERADLIALLTALRDRAGFSMNTYVTAVDHFPKEPRYEISYQFLAPQHRDRVRVKTFVTSDDASVPTCTPLWPGASFSERECFDMFGVRFSGHPDLRRLLMPDGYDHHPLRKDFPHQGIEPDRLYREWDRERRQDWDDEAR
jgi:NADH-quinone oxidoreductase subunit C